MVSTGSPNRCEATKANGEPCGAFAVRGSRFCFAHCPERAQERRAAQSRGGRARHRRVLQDGDQADPVHLETVADVVAVLESALGELVSLEPSVAKARAVGYLCGQALAAFQVGEIENRLAELEAKQGA